MDIAEIKPLFYKLDPIPSRLEIETWPPGATLYVNGNRARTVVVDVLLAWANHAGEGILIC